MSSLRAKVKVGLWWLNPLAWNKNNKLKNSIPNVKFVIQITPVQCLPNPELSYLLTHVFPRCLMSHFWAVSDGKIPVSRGRWELMKCLWRSARRDAQKKVCWIGGFLTQGYCWSHDLEMKRGAFMPLWDGLCIDWRWVLPSSPTRFLSQNWLDVTDLEISRNVSEEAYVAFKILIHLWICKFHFPVMWTKSFIKNSWAYLEQYFLKGQRLLL